MVCSCLSGVTLLIFFNFHSPPIILSVKFWTLGGPAGSGDVLEVESGTSVAFRTLQAINSDIATS